MVVRRQDRKLQVEVLEVDHGQDLDGDGCIYYITDRATGETRTVDNPEYDAFMQGLNIGEEMQLDYKGYTAENVNAIQ